MDGFTDEFFKPFNEYENCLFKEKEKGKTEPKPAGLLKLPPILKVCVNKTGSFEPEPAGLLKSLTALAVLAYKDESEVKSLLSSKVEDFEWIDKGSRLTDTQGFMFREKQSGHAVISFRGTKGGLDVLTDVLVKPRGMLACDSNKYFEKYFVHSGFQKALEIAWPQIGEYISTKILSDPERKVFLCGHSLGGALATLAGARLVLSAHKDIFAGLVTIGSPRVMTTETAAAVEKAMEQKRIARIFRSKDPVAMVPYRPFKHVSGVRCFIRDDGKLVISGSECIRMLDSWSAVLRTAEDIIGSAAVPGLHRGFSQITSDHDSNEYLNSVAERIASGENPKSAKWWSYGTKIIAPLAKIGVAGSVATAGATAGASWLKKYDVFKDLGWWPPEWWVVAIVLLVVAAVLHLYMYGRLRWPDDENARKIDPTVQNNIKNVNLSQQKF